MFQFANKPKNVNEILSDAYLLYRQTFRKVWYLALIIIFIASVQKLSSVVSGQTTSTGSQNNGMHIGFISAMYLLILMFVSAFFTATILHRLYSLTKEPRSHLTASLEIAKNKIFTVFVCMLITSAFVSIGMLMLVVPGIVVAILFAFYLPNILLRNDNVIDSLSNSIKLVWGVGYWLRTFAVLLPPGIIMAGSLHFLPLIMGKDNLLGQMSGEIIIATLVIPYLNSVILVQYNDLLLRHNRQGVGVTQLESNLDRTK